MAAAGGEETPCRLSATHGEVTAASVGCMQDTQRLIPHTFTALVLLSRGQMHRHAQLHDVTPSCDKLDQYSAVVKKMEQKTANFMTARF